MINTPPTGECAPCETVLTLIAGIYEKGGIIMRLTRNLGIAMSLLAGIFYVSVRNAAADQLGFAVDATGNLYTVDLTTATATPSVLRGN